MAESVESGPANQSGGAVLTNPDTMGVASEGGGSACLVFQPGGSQIGPVVFSSWSDLVSQLSALRNGANGGGCYTIQFDDSIVTPAVIPPGSYNMDGVTWEGRPTATGNFVNIDDGASLPGLRHFRGVNVNNLNTATPPIILVNGDIILLEGAATIQTTIGGTPFYDGGLLNPGDVVVFIVREASFLGTPSGPVVDVPVAGTFLFISMEGIAGIDRDAIFGGAGAFMQLAASSMNTIVTIFPNFTGTIVDPRLDAPGSVLPQPFLGPPSPGSFLVFPSQWARFSDPGLITQMMPSISGAFNSQTSPGEVVIVSNYGPGLVDLIPSGGDTINGGAGPFAVPIGGALTLISDGVSDWRIIAAFP